MVTTRTTLIDRVKDPNDGMAWSEFHRLYSSLVYEYARARGLNDTSATDVVSECMDVLSKRVRSLDFDPKQDNFREFLRVLVAQKIIEYCRRTEVNEADSALFSDLRGDHNADELWDRIWEVRHLLHCLSRVEQEVSPIHARAFRMVAIDEQASQKVAEQLGLSSNHVHQIKIRMTHRLRELVQEIGQE